MWQVIEKVSDKIYVAHEKLASFTLITVSDDAKYMLNKSSTMQKGINEIKITSSTLVSLLQFT